MAKTDNLSDFLTDVANSIRTKTGTTEQINAQDFSDKILSIQTGGGSGSTLKNLLDATKSTYYLFYTYKGTSVDGLIPYGDTENVTDMNNMFIGCSKLTTIPLFNTSNVTNMGAMFYQCGSLTTIPQLDTSNVTNMYQMFSYCYALTTIPLLNTSNVTNMEQMFLQCGSLTTIPQLDTSNVTNMVSMFSYCYALTTVPALDVSNVTDMTVMFNNCRNLKSILMTNIGADLDISDSTKFEREDLLTILNNLKTVTETKTLTMGATNLAKLTEEDKAIATNKGWTLA